ANGNFNEKVRNGNLVLRARPDHSPSHCVSRRRVGPCVRLEASSLKYTRPASRPWRSPTREPASLCCASTALNDGPGVLPPTLAAAERGRARLLCSSQPHKCRLSLPSASPRGQPYRHAGLLAARGH